MSSEQQHLFELAPPPWEADDEGEQLVATVVFSTGPEQTFDYLVPEELRSRLEPGRRVQVPFGKSNRKVVGYCVDLTTQAYDFAATPPVVPKEDGFYPIPVPGKTSVLQV